MSEHWTPSLGALGKSASVRFWLHIPELGAPTITLEELIDEVHHSRLPFDERLRHDVQISLCGNGGERRKASTTLLGLLSGRVALPGLGAACGVPTGGPDTLPAGLVEAAVVSILQIDRAVADRDWAQLVTLMHATADVCAAQRRAMRAMEEAAGQDAAFAPPPSEVLNALGAGASAQAHCLSTTSCFLSTLPALLLSRALGEGGHQAACGARLGLASLAVRLAWLHLDEPGLARHAVLALVGATGGPDGRGLSEDDLCAAWLPCLESGAPALLLECADRCAGDDEVALAAADALRCAAASQAPDAAAAFCDQYSCVAGAHRRGARLVSAFLRSEIIDHSLTFAVRSLGRGHAQFRQRRAPAPAAPAGSAPVGRPG